MHGEATTFGSMYLTTIPRRDTWRGCSKRTPLSGTHQTNIVEEKVICYQLELGKELADVSTECSSRHQGEILKLVTDNLLFIYAETTEYIVQYITCNSLTD